MAIYYSQILLYSLFIYCFLFLKTEALTLNLTNIGSDQHQNFNITGFPDAYISSQGLQLTSDASNVSQGISGKATYIDPLHLWDNSTGNLTDFYTRFTFVIDSRGATEFADGIAFFLAPNGSNSTAGGAIGLPLTQDWSKPTSPFVAVEFGTYQNVAVDPLNISPVTHIGIDVNSVKSYVTAVWYCNITHGIENEAWIRHDSSSKNLSVVFTSSTNTTRVEDTIHLACGRRPTYYEGDKYETRRLVEWVWDLYWRGKLLEAADSKLGEDFNEEMKRLLVAGLWCAHPDSKLRPSIREAIQVLNFEAPSPCLPSAMPVAMY
ncbi:hypothetical protein Vadar_009320 [Vaccinium darrowii]|uniref:Uncharacterized protein n=1 Tax=Vaccinium darrowii TaxID=229202 RepID=A0ACB7YUH2_9ERIC|nr:hypothetical protein Vadar_009320 [Vaccinium darrowii]